MKKIILLEVIFAATIMISFSLSNTTNELFAFHPPGEHPEPCESQCNPCPCPHDENGHHDDGYSSEDMYFHSPKVEFPSQAEIFDYLTEYGIKKEFTLISNDTLSIPKEISTSIANDNLWVAWIASAANNNSTSISNLTSGDNVMISVSRDNGEKYESPLQLTPEEAGQLSNLQLVTSDSGRYVDLIWLDQLNSTSTLYLSVSSNFGQDFKTYPLTLPNFVNASDPIFKANGENVLLVWKETINQNGTNGDVMYSHSRHW
jgi:hypothetical protein